YLTRSVDVTSSLGAPTHISTLSLGAARAAVQHGLFAGWIQLVHHARTHRAAAESSPVEVAGRVADHTGSGSTAIGTAGEAVQYSLFAGRIQLKNHAAPCIPIWRWYGTADIASGESSSVEVDCGLTHKPRGG